jgi:hypothetical protein
MARPSRTSSRPRYVTNVAAASARSSGVPPSKSLVAHRGRSGRTISTNTWPSLVWDR